MTPSPTTARAFATASINSPANSQRTYVAQPESNEPDPRDSSGSDSDDEQSPVRCRRANNIIKNTATEWIHHDTYGTCARECFG
ncbi:hypothetical protein JCM9803A_01000 [Rhodococcus erythropolis]